VTDSTPATPEHTPAAGGPAEPPPPAAGAGAHDPWSREADTVAGPVVSADDHGVPASSEAVPGIDGGTVTDMAYGLGPDGLTAPEAPARRRRTPIVIAAAAALVVLLGAGAYAGMRYYTGANIVEPESAVPASVTAFARIDLNPSLRDQLSLHDLLARFPHGTTAESRLTSAEKKATARLGLDFDTDVKPWFGGRIGVAAWPDGQGKDVPVIALASTDDAKATSAMATARRHLGTTFGYHVGNGYALVVGPDKDAQADADAIAKQAAAHSLASSTAYRDAVAHVGPHPLAVAYADLGQLGKLLTKSMDSGALGLDSAAGDPFGADGGDPTGLPPVSLGGLGSLAGGNGLGSLGALGGLTGAPNALTALKGTVVVGASVVDDGVEIRVHAQGATAATGTATNVHPTLDAMPDGTVVGFATDGMEPNSPAAQQMQQMLDGLPGLGAAKHGFDPSTLSKPLTTMLTSKVISLSLTGTTGMLPSGFLAVDTRDAGSAQDLLSSLNGLTGGHPIPGVTFTGSGTHVRATMGSPATGGKLGGSALYRKATDGMSNETAMGYVDLTRIGSLFGPAGAADTARATKALGPVQAVGFGAHSSGGTSDELIRVIIG